MPSVYLQSSDYANYGVSASATAAQVTQASGYIDAYLQRPEGLIWVGDGNGVPCYMQAKIPDFTLNSSGAISPGSNVTVTVTGPIGAVQVGYIAILDRANTNLTEACSIVGINGSVLTLSNVQFSHASNCTLDIGLTIFEERQMPQGRPLTTVSKTPVIQVLNGQGRYGYGRRGTAGNYEVNEYNLLATVTKFGGPPIWEPFPTSNLGVNPNTGELWIPAGILLAYYTEIRINYVAGWSYASLPYEIKQACANLINASINSQIVGNTKRLRAGDTEIERFAATYIDNDTKILLDPFKARVFG